MHARWVWLARTRVHGRGAARRCRDAGLRITTSDPLVIVGYRMAAACLCEELAGPALGPHDVAVIRERDVDAVIREKPRCLIACSFR